MAFLSRQRDLSALIAESLTIALFVGGMPLLSGVTLMVNHGAPAFTLDICHPLPGVNHSSGFFAVPLVSGPAVQRPFLFGPALKSQTPFVIRESEAPDPPPPKLPG
jgi:hypothetical protein